MDNYLATHLIEEEKRYGDINIKLVSSIDEKKQAFSKKHNLTRKCRFLLRKIKSRVR